MGCMTLLGIRDVTELSILRHGGDTVSVTLWTCVSNDGLTVQKKCRFPFSSAIKQSGQPVPSACARPSFFLRGVEVADAANGARRTE